MKNRCILIFLLSLVIALCLSSCTESAADEKSFFLMDTLVTVKSTDVSDELVWQCEGRIYEIESAISKTAEESDVYKFNRSDEGVALSDDSSELISRVLSLCPLVNGAYDPTLASVCELWDITGDAKIPEEKELSMPCCTRDIKNYPLTDRSFQKTIPN